MKKAVRFLCLYAVMVVVLLSGSGCMSKVLKENIVKLRERFPDAAVSEKNGDILMVRPVDFDAVSLEENAHDNGTRRIYTGGWEQLKAYTALDNCVVVLVQKAGQSKQVSVFNESVQCTDFHTETPMKVTRVFYGNIEPGRLITVKENAAILTDVNGKEAIQTYGGRLIEAGKTYLACLRTDSGQFSQEKERLYYPFSYNCIFPMDEVADAMTSKEALVEKIIQMSDEYDEFRDYNDLVDFDRIWVDLVEQYIFPETPDLRLDVRTEALKLMDVIPGSKYQSEERKALETKSEAEVLDLLTPNQRKLLDDMVERYGKK